MKRLPSFPATLAVLVLAAALCQVGLGAHFSSSGEQVGMALPVATLVLVLAVVCFFVWRRSVPPLVLGWGQAGFLLLACVGLLGMTRHDIPPATKELIQLAEIMVLAPCLFYQLAARAGWPALRNAFAGCGVGLLLLGVCGLHRCAFLQLSDAKLAALVVLSLPFWVAVMVTFPPGLLWAAMAGTGLLTGLALGNGGLLLCWTVVLVVACLRFRQGRVAAVLAVALAFGGAWWTTPPVSVMPSAAPVPRLAAGAMAAAAGDIRPPVDNATAVPAAAPSVEPTVAYKSGGRASSTAESAETPAAAGTGAVAHSFGPWNALNPRFDAQHYRRAVIEAVAAVNAPRYFPFGGGLGTYRRTINTLRQYGTEQPSPLDMKVPRDGNSQYLILLVESGLPAALALVLLLLGTVCGRGLRRAGTDPQADAQAVTIGTALLGALLAGIFCVILSRGIGIWVGALLGLAAWRTGLPARRVRWLCAVIAGAGAGVGLVVLAGHNTRLDREQHLSAANREARILLFHDDIAPQPTVRVLELPDEIPGGGAAADLVQVEGESCVSLTPPFVRVPANDASGGLVLAIPDLAGKGVGSAEYHVTIPEDGTYTLEARVFWDDGCSNSLLFQLGETSITLASEMFKQWHVLDAPQRLPLHKGALTVRVLNLEDGVKLDWWVLRRRGRAP